MNTYQKAIEAPEPDSSNTFFRKPLKPMFSTTEEHYRVRAPWSNDSTKVPVMISSSDVWVILTRDKDGNIFDIKVCQ